MSAFGFAHYYASSDVGDVCRLHQMSVSSLKPTNKRPSGKKKDLVIASSRRSMTLSMN